MKILRLLSVFILGSLLLTSCVADVIITDNVVEEHFFNTEEILNSHEIWYVDIERSRIDKEIPFFQKAFTVSFVNGTFFANNNLVGMGQNGNGFGLDVGIYDPIGAYVDIEHDLEGTYTFEVERISANEIKLYEWTTNTVFYLIGYQRNTFDYDLVFYENIHYFLHEYEVWEKIYTSQRGALNEFDEENYLQFLYYGSGDNFRSSRDANGIRLNDLIFDYEGYYEVNDHSSDLYRKTLTLDYDYLGNEFFELTVIDERTIELFHRTSGTTYEFKGRNLLQFKNAEKSKTSQNSKKRMKKAEFKKLLKI